VIYICLHGHFYQPPRENPWTGEIELQDSAKPFHDWNERIYIECYKPNSEAEIIDDHGTVVDRVNNYEILNFNIGPTLLAWIRNKHPETYNKIIEADKTSISSHNGHGNAIAMCYSHMIMPLANLNDKITQVKWGLADFKNHFGRDSEGIWLPETAVNDETVEVLINEGVKYIILDTSQALKTRKIGEDKWTDVSNNTINPKRPYRRFSKIDKDKFIDIFFYDGPVSKSVAFDDVLTSSQNLLSKIFQAADKTVKAEQLIGIATDGETFGHHKRFAERTLAYFMKALVPQNNIKIVNFGEYLSLHQPEYEVTINLGPYGEGTSWSCSHGVRRWKDNCGDGGGGGWNQKWRKPLRESLDWLRNNLIIIFESMGKEYFKDVWKARNEYIYLLLDNSNDNIHTFMTANAQKQLSEAEIKTSLTLLEMQKYAMLMYTSDGWFFSEISGIETVKILEYASRAMELAKELANISFEEEFLKRLSQAKSNLAEYKNGKGVYEKLVKTAHYSD